MCNCPKLDLKHCIYSQYIEVLELCFDDWNLSFRQIIDYFKAKQDSAKSISSVENIFHTKDKITTLREYFQMRHNYNGSDHHSGRCHIAWLLCQRNWEKYIHLHVHGSEAGPKRRVDAL